MKDFNRSLRLLLKRNGFWLLLALLFTLIIVAVGVNGKINKRTQDMALALIEMDNLVEDGKVSDDPTNTIVKKLKEKYPNKLPTGIFEEYDKIHGQLLDKFNLTYEKDTRAWVWKPHTPKDVLNNYESLKNDKMYYNSFIKDIDTEGNVVVGVSAGDVSAAIIIFSSILAVLFTSLEHITSYFEFTRMLPWSRGKNYLMKLALGILLVTLAFAIGTILTTAMWSTSYLSNYLTFENYFREVLFAFGKNIFYFVIAMGVGAVSGNIIGHAGMMIIALTGPNLWTLNYRYLREIFDFPLLSSDKLFNFEMKLNSSALKPLYTPIYGLFTDKTSMLIGLGLVALIVFGLGYYWSIKGKAERSGMLILTKGTSMYAFVLAISTTAIILNGIIMEAFWVNTSPIVSIAAFAVTAFIAYKIYKILFNIKIGV